ncbi:MAG: hypothetical protein UH850_10820 [Paludibacteraceae bacterium]|nr:hypothetical protein [Paludibacteraceae bacterium]
MNFKFLPFVFGMALVSTAANAADGSFTNLTVSNNATVSNNLIVSKRLQLDHANGESCNFLICRDLSKPTYNTMFYVSSNGHAISTGLTVRQTSADHCCEPALGIRYNNNTGKNGFEFTTSSYMGNFYPMFFEATKFTFDRGEVVINNKLTCKDELEVVGVTASTIKADDINVNMSNAADYVFDENYDLKSLSEVESYVNEHKHLPGIPSAAEMEQNGISVSAMSNMLLEKVEELTLHMIQLKKENEALKAEVKSLKK